MKRQCKDEEGSKIRIKDYKKTSMYKSIQVFEEFVRCLEETWKGNHVKIAISGKFIFAIKIVSKNILLK